MVDSMLHGHQEAMQGALLFSASPEQLGLGEGKLKQTISYRPILTKSTVAGADVGEPAGGANNKALVDYVMRNLEASQLTAPGEGESIPQLICNGTRRRASIGGAVYDRHMVIKCAQWSFESGQQYTILSMHGNPEIDASKFGQLTEYQ